MRYIEECVNAPCLAVVRVLPHGRRSDGDSGVGFRQAPLGETCPLQTKINNHRLTWFSPGFLPLQNGHKVMNVACGTAYWSLLFIFFLLRLIATQRLRVMWQVKCWTSSPPPPTGLRWRIQRGIQRRELRSLRGRLQRAVEEVTHTHAKRQQSKTCLW